MICYKPKLFSSQKYNIFMLKDEIQLQHENEIERIKLNSFQPRFKWTQCDSLEIGQFELLDNQQSRIYKIEPSMGMLLKEFLNGKVCFQGIDNQYRIAKIISKGNSGSIVKMRNLYNGELVTCKIYKLANSEFIQKFRNEVQALQFLKHKNLPKIKEYYIEANHNYIIYDLVEGTRLDICIKNNILDNQQIIQIMKELIRLIQYMQLEGFSHQNIKLENIYYYSLMNQLTVVNFGKTVFRSQAITPSDSYFSKTTKDYSDFNSNSCRNTSADKDIFDCGLVFFQLSRITQKIQDCKQIHYQDDYKPIMSLITEIHNQKISSFLMKLFLQNKTSDKFSESLLQEIDMLNLELFNYRNN